MVVNITHTELLYWNSNLQYLSNGESYLIVDFLPFGCWKNSLSHSPVLPALC